MILFRQFFLINNVLICIVFSLSTATSREFGHGLLTTDFLLNYTNFNHGSFGACPRSVLHYQASLRLEQEQQPDVWMRHHYKELVNATRQAIADLVDADSMESIVLTESASTAVNSVMRSMSWKPGDIVLHFSVAYGMVKNTIAYLVEMEQVEAVEVQVQLPISDTVGANTFIDPFQTILQSMRKDRLDRLRLVVLEHIVSNPAMREPIEALASLTKWYNPKTFVLVDGAHTLGQIPHLSISKLANMDAYLSNGHKWLYSPKGSAFLWMNQSSVTDFFPQPTVISSENRIGTMSLEGRFEYVSTRDYTATISMVEAIQFRNSFGGDIAIYNYVHRLAMDAKHYLQNLWNVSSIVPDSMEDFMFQVRLPLDVVTEAQIQELQSWLLKEHNMYIIVVHDKPSNLYYTRLSSQIYLEMSDFQRLGDLVLDFPSAAPAVVE